MNKVNAFSWIKDDRPKIMGVLNVTPDSFFDGGNSYSEGELKLDVALRHAEEMIGEGADIIDVGGESTRPGAAAISVEEEADRVLPVVQAIVDRFDTLVSVDTSTAGIMTDAAKLGAHLINDVRALQRAGALEAASASGMAVCLMHMQGAPKTMQSNPHYESASSEVFSFLESRKRACVSAGIPEDAIIVDPGIGFGKNDEHNIELIRHIQTFSKLGPVLIGVSRKSMFGRLLGRELRERLAGSLAVALIAAQKGARILRVHDVAETRDILTILELIEQQ